MWAGHSAPIKIRHPETKHCHSFSDQVPDFLLMFWFKGKEPEQSTKDKQIRELTSAFPSIKRPNQDDNLFEIIFEIDRKYNTLRIYLPNDFPTTKPGEIILFFPLGVY